MGQRLAKYQPCGCIICTCAENEENRCMGCGANHCDTHPLGQIPHPVYVPTDRAMTREEYHAMRQTFVDARQTTNSPPHFRAAWAHIKAGSRIIRERKIRWYEKDKYGWPIEFIEGRGLFYRWTRIICQNIRKITG